MSGAILNSLDLKGYKLENLPLLNKLRKEHFKARCEVCIERARYITQYLRDMSSPDETMESRYAKAVNSFPASARTRPAIIAIGISIANISFPYI